MKTLLGVFFVILSGIVMVATPAQSQIRDRATRDFKHIDANEDGKLSRKEWNRRGNFSKLDTDKDPRS